MLLPRQKELQFKDFNQDFNKFSAGIYLDDRQGAYQDINVSSTFDARAGRALRKPTFYDDAVSEDFQRAPASALKSRGSYSQKPAAGSFLAKAGSMQVGGAQKLRPEPTLHDSQFKAQNPLVGFSEGEQ